MNENDRRDHWEKVYVDKSDFHLSGYEEVPSASLELAEHAGINSASVVIDIGGGTSRFAECLIDRGVRDVSVLDLSRSALDANRSRLGLRGKDVTWLVADITTWKSERQYDLWHDRAVFHFLVKEKDRAAYLDCLNKAVKAGGHAIIATFVPDGPEKCSGLPVERYSPESLSVTLGEAYKLLEYRFDIHVTPWGSEQRFQFSLFEKRKDGSATSGR
ncbi:class I SAM-dependent methyltransferase [Ovoidimarina sediminis]|uniref:class I SAM-dependent methyltransferase n=1 Tax=Ovoidimarina sediminis TaxID=3079856 RepID=UPI00291126A7|nr:class I SAM-dependent methyltransferase [Rhodophyticola sp. MJ-SS7]MDU8945957.1 class I SAM-dependent methyltransferase [Rhodophyticola sp. MJ-SS7]